MPTIGNSGFGKSIAYFSDIGDSDARKEGPVMAKPLLGVRELKNFPLLFKSFAKVFTESEARCLTILAFQNLLQNIRKPGAAESAEKRKSVKAAKASH